MQDFLVSLIVAAAAWIVWKHVTPRSLRLSLNRVSLHIAMKMGWQHAAEKLAEKSRIIAGESACGTCNGCRPNPPSGCEIRIRPEDIRKK